MAVALIVEGVVNLVLSVALVRPLGLTGVAVGTAIPSLAVSLGFVPWYLRRHLQIPIAELAGEVWVRPIIAMVPFALLTVLIERLWAAQNLAVFFAQVAAVLPLAVVGAVAFGLSPQDRRDLGARVGALASRWARPGR